MTAFFDSLGYVSRVQRFIHHDPRTDRSIPMANLIFRAPRDTGAGIPPAALFCAHYDSRPRSERDPDSLRRMDSLPAANDGASGVALLMELAAMFQATPPDAPVEFVFFDGEDWGEEGDPDQYLLGSSAFSRTVSGDHYRWGVLVDVFAHHGARWYREGNSQKYAEKVNSLIWSVGHDLGIPRFVDSTGFAVHDDHVPLLTVGVQCIDIIDLNYSAWHTTADLAEMIDTLALSDAGRTLAECAYRESRRM